MAIELATKYIGYVDELFSTEAKHPLVTSTAFEWDGAQTVKIYKVTTAAMNDYGRGGAAEGNWSRYGAVAGLDATTETLTLSKDRSFAFAIDTLDNDETAGALDAAAALARQIREVVIPEIDAYVLGQICADAGTAPAAKTLTAANIYGEILAASEALDTAEVPETDRVLIVPPATYTLMKQSSDIVLETDIGMELRRRGVLGYLDGAVVIKAPANRLPSKCGFLLCHPCATVAPVKLAAYRIHQDPPGLSGSLVEGRVVYDAFVFENKTGAIYYQATT